jgi:hypothetical protein
MAKKLGKKCANLGLKFGVLIICEIEQGFFCQTLCAGNFLLVKKSLVKLSPGSHMGH